MAAARDARDATPWNGREVDAASRWVPIDISGPGPMLEMYRDILRQHGIRAIITDAGVGPGALGGVPGFGMLRVAVSDAAAARTLLRADDSQEDAAGAAPDGQ